jgi:serine/threonine protein kinase
MNNPVQVLGDFELIRELGRGGMGIVYEARQVSLNRKVALKVLKAGLGLTTQAVTRFRREAAAAAKLHHTNIVPIYATGEDGEYHFYAMELIEGSSLDRIIRAARKEREGGVAGDSKLNSRESSEAGSTKCPTKCATKANDSGLTTLADETSDGADRHEHKPGETTTTLQSGTGYFDQIARMFAEVADGLEHAHRQGVIHRDIKPSNLLVSPQGRLHLTDFGLARVLEEPGMTVTGEFMGSPLYMSPEQIAAGRALLDHRTDIYSLGTTLYEAITLQPPFQGERRDQVISQILHKDPKPPRAIDRRIPPDLETICLKAMDKDPDRRYRTAGAFAEDLRRYVNRFAIKARRANVVQRAVKWGRRHPAIAVAAATAVVALLLVGVFARQAQLANGRLLEEKRQTVIQDAVLAARGGDTEAAERAIDRAEALHASAGEIRMLRGQVALDRGHVGEAIQHLKQAVILQPTSVAAQALLASAYYGAYKWVEFEAILLKLDRFPCQTAEDFLFKGMAQAVQDPEQGIQTLNEGIHRGDSIMARMIRADALARYALLKGDPEEMRRAREDMIIARGMKPDNPAVLRLSLDLHTEAAALFRWKGLTQDRQTELASGAVDLHALDSVHTAMVADAKGFYWQEAGDEDKAVREWAPYAAGEDAGWILEHYVPVLYGQGRVAQALALLDHHHAPDQPDLRPFFLAETPDGPRRAYEAWRAAGQAKLDGWSAVVGLLPLQLLGHRDEAAAAFLALRRTLQVPYRNHWYERLLDYETGILTDAQLLTLAGASQWNLCEGHFYIAFKKLAEGDRASAHDHFRQSAATPVTGFIEHRWSRAFLRRMQSDPNWPPWIPARGPNDSTRQP